MLMILTLVNTVMSFSCMEHEQQGVQALQLHFKLIFKFYFFWWYFTPSVQSDSRNTRWWPHPSVAQLHSSLHHMFPRNPAHTLQMNLSGHLPPVPQQSVCCLHAFMQTHVSVWVVPKGGAVMSNGQQGSTLRVSIRFINTTWLSLSELRHQFVGVIVHVAVCKSVPRQWSLMPPVTL